MPPFFAFPSPILPPFPPLFSFCGGLFSPPPLLGFAFQKGRAGRGGKGGRGRRRCQSPSKRIGLAGDQLEEEECKIGDMLSPLVFEMLKIVLNHRLFSGISVVIQLKNSLSAKEIQFLDLLQRNAFRDTQ